MKVLVIGGYGAFGARIVRRLKRIQNLDVLTGGRNPSKADVVLDVKHGPSLAKVFTDLKFHLVIHTAGPFDETEGYAVAKACLAASNTGHKCNYLDLADNISYVMGFGALDEEAQQKGCLLVTGASTTPAITTSIISHNCPSFFTTYPSSVKPSRTNTFSPLQAPLSHFDTLSSIDINLSVANSSMPGEGTVKSVLSYCGAPIRNIQDNTATVRYGWKTLASKRFPGMTSDRWCSDVSVPDNDIFTAHLTPPPRSSHAFPTRISTTQKGLSDFQFRAGVESSVSMLGLSLFATLKAKGLLPSSLCLTDVSSPLLQLNKVLNVFSSGKGQGGMSIDMVGTPASSRDREDMSQIKTNEPGNQVHVRWGLSANENTGPEIPCTPAIIIASKLRHLYQYRNAQVHASRVLVPQYLPGARVCADMVSLDDFTDAIQLDELDIQQYVTYEECRPADSSSGSGGSNQEEKEQVTSLERSTKEVTGSSTCTDTDLDTGRRWCDLSPTFTALDHMSQHQLPDAICAVHAMGGVVSGDLLVSMSRFPLVRLSSLLVGLPVPGWVTPQQTYKFLVNMEKQKWQRFCLPVDTRSSEDIYSRKTGVAAAGSVFTSSFAMRCDDQLLTESVMGGLIQFSMQQKALTRLRDTSTGLVPGERPWVYTGFEGVCVQTSLFGGYLPLPTWLAPTPHCITTPHADGLGWDLLATLSLPLLGEVVRYEGPLRIAHSLQDGYKDAVPNTNQSENRPRNPLQLQAAIRHIYGVQTVTDTTSFQKILGKYLLIYDSDCVICDASVASLIERDEDNMLMFSSIHDSQSQQLLSQLGVPEQTFQEQKDQTIFVITPLGAVLTHSDALLALLRVLPGAQCSVLHTLLRGVPRWGRDRVYGYVARNRHTLLTGTGTGTGTGSGTGSGTGVGTGVGTGTGVGEAGGALDSCTLLTARTPAERARYL